MSDHFQLKWWEILLLSILIPIGLAIQAIAWPFMKAWRLIKRLFVFCAILGLLLGMSGCGSIGGVAMRVTNPSMVIVPYMPTLLEWESKSHIDNTCYSLCVLADIPFTAVTDTVLLPVDLPLAAYNTTFWTY
jgi:uncharacterized protein YceK